MKSSNKIKNSLHHLILALKQIDPSVISAKQIRQSVIALWLKTEDVRKVQYKAGHRYVSSTETYLINDLEDLQEDINKYHPSSAEAFGEGGW